MKLLLLGVTLILGTQDHRLELTMMEEDLSQYSKPSECSKNLDSDLEEP